MNQTSNLFLWEMAKRDVPSPNFVRPWRGLAMAHACDPNGRIAAAATRALLVLARLEMESEPGSPFAHQMAILLRAVAEDSRVIIRANAAYGIARIAGQGDPPEQENYIFEAAREMHIQLAKEEYLFIKNELLLGEKQRLQFSLSK